jgi:hypothetical protein
MQCFPISSHGVMRDNLDAATKFRIKGRCWNALRALSAIPAVVLLSSKPSTISGEPPMASLPKTPHHRHTPSADSGKYEDPPQGRIGIGPSIGQPSAETFYVRDDNTPIYPNNWARIRLAPETIHYSPDAYVMSQRDHTGTCS